MFVHSNMGWALDLQARQALWMLVPQSQAHFGMSIFRVERC